MCWLAAHAPRRARCAEAARMQRLPVKPAPLASSPYSRVWTSNCRTLRDRSPCPALPCCCSLLLAGPARSRRRAAAGRSWPAPRPALATSARSPTTSASRRLWRSARRSTCCWLAHLPAPLPACSGHTPAASCPAGKPFSRDSGRGGGVATAITSPAHTSAVAAAARRPRPPGPPCAAAVAARGPPALHALAPVL